MVQWQCLPMVARLQACCHMQMNCVRYGIPSSRKPSCCCVPVTVCKLSCQSWIDGVLLRRALMACRPYDVRCRCRWSGARWQAVLMLLLTGVIWVHAVLLSISWVIFSAIRAGCCCPVLVVPCGRDWCDRSTTFFMLRWRWVPFQMRTRDRSFLSSAMNASIHRHRRRLMGSIFWWGLQVRMQGSTTRS